MATTYQNQPVTIVRPARAEDVGYDATKHQVIIQKADGSLETVLRKDVKHSDKT